jgi:glycerol-3-phosphate dehydrogenase (NAD(P)+)
MPIQFTSGDREGAPGGVTFIGESSMGITLAHHVASNGRRSTLCCLEPQNAVAIKRERRHWLFPDVVLSANLDVSSATADSVRDAALVIVAVPSAKFRGVVRALAPHICARHIVLPATKGFDPQSHERMSEILHKTTCAGAVGAISGPNITTEIMERRPMVIVVASPSPEALQRAAGLLAGNRFGVHGNRDLVGVELIGALKNAVAIAVGIAMGLQLGVNACSVIFARGLSEIRYLAASLGAQPLTFSGLSGLSDLYLTCVSPDSLNRRLGIEIGRGRRVEEVLAGFPEIPEGVNSVAACHALATGRGISLPIAATTYGILQGTLEARALGEVLLHAPSPFEVDDALFSAGESRAVVG